MGRLRQDWRPRENTKMPDGFQTAGKVVGPLVAVIEDRNLNQTIAACRRLNETLQLAKGHEDAERKRLIADAHHDFACVVTGFCKLSEGNAR